MTAGPEPAGVVIVAVDFGDASARAVAYAGHVARALRARLVALHAEAFDAPPYFTLDQVDRLMGERASLGAQAREYLGTFVGTHTAAAFEARIESRVPADAILHHADQADIVVMGTHGRRGASRWWLGSVAERVLRGTPVPLLVVHAAAPEPAHLRAIAVHADEPLAGTSAFAVALRLGRALEIEVRDERGRPAAGSATAGAGDDVLTVVAIPAVPRGGAGAPLVRASSGATLFVPE